ncbi:MAG TPA: GntR family transcriptional regulator [Candidatus Acidoferrales bacterium]
MQLWFAHDSGVTLREQLVTQIILGILSEDLAAGQRLPSTRELARRFHLHPNTVSGGYRQLEREQWVAFRHGSGVYVRETKPEGAQGATFALDRLVANLFRETRRLEIPLAMVRSRLRHWFNARLPDHFLVIEPDEELRKILTFELRQAVRLPVESCGLSDSKLPRKMAGAIPISLAGKEKLVRRVVPEGVELLMLQVRSVPSSLAEWLPAPPGVLLGVASRWPGFLKMARTMLAAAGFEPESLIFRDARKANWRRGLKEAKAVVCDLATAVELPKTRLVVPFPLVARASLVELKGYEEFVGGPVVSSSK